MMAAVIAIYYVAVVAWALSYLWLSLSLGWGEQTNSFFFNQFLGLNESSTPLSPGLPQWHLILPLSIVWGITFIATFRGIKTGIERANKILMPTLFILTLLLIVRVLTLPGAFEGINWMLKPDFSRIWDHKVWSAAYGQIFFTLSIGFAIMIGYSSYLPKKSDISNNATMTVLINCGFSILSGIVIFGALGFMAQSQGKELTEVVTQSVGLAFVTLPQAINEMPGAALFGPAFFLSLVFAGVSSHISISEACASALMDKLGWSRHTTVAIFCGSGFLLSLLFVTNGGILILDLVDHFINHIALFAGCFLELILIAWIAKPKRLQQHINHHSDFPVGSWWLFCIKYVSPAVLAFLVISNLYGDLNQNYGGYSDSAILLLGWGLIGALLILAVAINIFEAKEVESDR